MNPQSAPLPVRVLPGGERAAASAQAILDTALALGERQGWDAVHLHEIARRLGIPLAEVRRCFEHKDALAEAWFDRADAAMLALASAPEWLALTPRQRLQQAICGWLDALAPHRRLTAAMLRYKFQPEHLHLQAQGIVRISRTVQWLRDAAHLPQTGWRREAGEAALTALFLATFVRWLADDSPDARSTRALLDRLLALAERAALRLGE